MKRPDLQNYAELAALAVNLSIPAEYREGVLNNLETIFSQSTRLMSLALPVLDEPAPVARPADDSRPN